MIRKEVPKVTKEKEKELDEYFEQLDSQRETLSEIYMRVDTSSSCKEQLKKQKSGRNEEDKYSRDALFKRSNRSSRNQSYGGEFIHNGGSLKSRFGSVSYQQGTYYVCSKKQRISYRLFRRLIKSALLFGTAVGLLAATSPKGAPAILSPLAFAYSIAACWQRASALSQTISHAKKSYKVLCSLLAHGRSESSHPTPHQDDSNPTSRCCLRKQS